ncbi:glycosyltransferase [Actinoallomurus purpureus]|uniref:glycosyltransferase family 2 protein n=1 Tax=Actinoallomurus purpureus TaxID=478114 RepID=UPI0020921D16|nr:glycosyltransferase [Actinoallomurus purpureus]MCO6009112.1 glycosyltransferase [Actinoallomurus purpureus]
MTHVITVVTPVHEPNLTFLSEAYASLLGQELPDGWTWQWVVQQDGDGGEANATLPHDERISFGSTARPYGPGVARTTALTRAAGELVRNLDADDRLLPGALSHDIEILTNNPQIGWTTSRALDLLPNGDTKRWEHGEPEEGIIERGEVLRFWREHDWMLPVVPGTLCIRRDLLLALGGWMALDTSEDTGLIIAANAVSDGYFISTPSMLYRKHSAQTTAQDFHNEPEHRHRKRLIIIARAEALSSLRSARLN